MNKLHAICTAVFAFGFWLSVENGEDLSNLLKAERDKTRTILSECEAKLPRNQNCKLIAVPDLEPELAPTCTEGTDEFPGTCTIDGSAYR